MQKFNFAELLSVFCHAGHTGSVDPAAKGCTDDLKSWKSSRGVWRPSSQGSSITNLRRMHCRFIYMLEASLRSAPLQTERMSCLIVVLATLGRTSAHYGKCKNTHMTTCTRLRRLFLGFSLLEIDRK